MIGAATAVAFGAAALVLTGHLERRAAYVCGLLGLVQIGVALGCSTVFALIAEDDGPVATWAALALASAVGSALVCTASARRIRSSAAETPPPRTTLRARSAY